MSGRTRSPSYRDFDFYRLVVVRRFKQRDVAGIFGVTAARVSQVLGRVEQWVNERVGDWLFPGRNDLRFYVALDREQIRVREGTSPEHVVIEHVSGKRCYARAGGSHSELADLDPDEAAKLRARAEAISSPNMGAKPEPNREAKPLNSAADSRVAFPAATSSGTGVCAAGGAGAPARSLAPIVSTLEKCAEL